MFYSLPLINSCTLHISTNTISYSYSKVLLTISLSSAAQCSTNQQCSGGIASTGKGGFSPHGRNCSQSSRREHTHPAVPTSCRSSPRHLSPHSTWGWPMKSPWSWGAGPPVVSEAPWCHFLGWQDGLLWSGCSSCYQWAEPLYQLLDDEGGCI